MDNQYKDLQDHYTDIDDFKRKAITSLAEGRARLDKPPFDFIDFFETEATLEYIAVGGYDIEDEIPVFLRDDETLADHRFCLHAQPLIAGLKPRKNKAPIKDKAKKKNAKNSK